MSREFVFTKPFVRDYQALPEAIRTEIDRVLKLLLDDPRHPSLQAKKMQPAKRGIFEARVTLDYRVTYTVDGSKLVMRRVGTHDILKTP